MSEVKIYQLKVTLDDINPPIWRRIQVPGNVSLLQFHFMLQIAMGWTNSHLHEFQIGDERFGTPFEDDWYGAELKEEEKYQLDQVIPARGDSFSYLYDFGDSWEHIIEVEEILDPSTAQSYPRCLGGARACPPEDVGGPWGYGEFLEAINNPDHPEHEDYLYWIGGAFEPEAFDPEQRDMELANYRQSEMVRAYRRYYLGEEGPELTMYQAVSKWKEGLSPEQRTQFAELPLRRDAVTLLTYLRDHSIRGTQSTGNLTLKAVREVTAMFVDPPVLDTKIGERVYKLRTEFDVWPLYFLHSLVEVGGLLEGGPGKKLRLTPKGMQFLDLDPPVQVWFLLETWWYHTNWLIAYPYRGMGEQLPYDFSYITLHHLLSLPVERSVPFRDFADRLIQMPGLRWESENMTYAQDSLRRSIRRMVIDILGGFQAVEKHMKKVPLGNSSYQELHAFTITRLGRGLLEVLAGNVP